MARISTSQKSPYNERGSLDQDNERDSLDQDTLGMAKHNDQERAITESLRQSLEAIVIDADYLKNLDTGKPRRGHPEATPRAHIADLTFNLNAISRLLSEEQSLKLKILIHTHDTFKADATRGARIQDPTSHSSLARTFLQKHTSDPDLLNMVQFHDEFYALWRQHQLLGHDEKRIQSMLSAITDWDVFLTFNIIDRLTPGKSFEPLNWTLEQVKGRAATTFDFDSMIELIQQARKDAMAGKT